MFLQKKLSSEKKQVDVPDLPIITKGTGTAIRSRAGIMGAFALVYLKVKLAADSFVLLKGIFRFLRKIKKAWRHCSVH